jgi:DNA-binding SARP family transcriptional activator/tetratricopeptide (TPR) repeat protein
VVLRVGVLGPVIALDGAQELPVGQPRQQAVLGILAMRANRVISRGELIDAVWGQDAPPSAEGGVYTYVAGLRRVFEPGRSTRGGGRILVSTGAGYMLHLVPGQPDAVTFEQHLAKARHLRRTDDLPGAVDALDQALSMWRGIHALAGVPGPFAETERTRLGELKSAANEDRADTLLALHRHEEVIADLTVMVADHPLRERMRGLLLIALYRSGRQAEALKVFAEGRRVLAEELGIDPGTELSRIHQQVLTSDPALDPIPLPGLATQARTPAPPQARPPAAAYSGSPPSGRLVDRSMPIPAQLPSEAPGFSGRHDELGVLHAMLKRNVAGQAPAVPIVVISGTAGVGKTALAVRFGRQVTKRFPDGQLFLNLRGFAPALDAVKPSDALRFFLDSLGVPPHRIPPDVEDRAALFRSMADGKRMLIVLDNAAGAVQVRPLLPGSPDCLVLVTSRNEITGLVAADGAVPVNLDVLSQDEAREMLNLRLGQDRARDDPRSADEIIAACARLPLALTIAVGRAAGRPKRPLAELAAELEQAKGGLSTLEEDDEATDVRAVFSWSYDQLSDEAARMFRLLGLHPGPDISLSAAASLAGAPSAAGEHADADRRAVAAALRELVRTHMVAEHVHARYGFHDLLRAYAADQAATVDPEPERRAATQRVLDHYLHSSLSALSKYVPHRSLQQVPKPAPGVAPVDVIDKQQALAWFDAEVPVLISLIRHADAGGFDEHAWLIPWAIGPYLRRRGRRQDWLEVARIALDAASRLGDVRGRAHSSYQLGFALSINGDNDAAEPNVHQALKLFRELEDRGHEAMVLNGLATMLEDQGRFAEALTVALDGLRMVKAAGHWWLQGTLENSVGWEYGHLGKYDKALAHCQRALGLHRESGNDIGVTASLYSIGYVCHELGDYPQARAAYEQAVAVGRESGLPLEEALALIGLGETLIALGEPAEARQAWLAAEAILDRLSHPQADEVRAKLAALDTRADPDRVTGVVHTSR